ncbi:MAG: methylglyoxal synthase [Oscillatoriales cyanobacterium RM2_1_1]|nr:methylglyoxal synthase [Oscillatoriales cyanobacterium RM2_1_1]
MAATIALIAHDRKKSEIVNFVQRHSAFLNRYRLIATGTTGQRIQENTNLAVERMLSGPLGGDTQIAAQVAEGKVCAVIFLVDPLYAQPHEPDIQALQRICAVYNIPLATNLATAEAIIEKLHQTAVAHLIFNPISGQGNADQDLAFIQKTLEPSYNVHLHLTTPELSAEQLTRQVIQSNPDLIIASGGDGTISAVAGELIGTDIPLGVIPRGTANAFALALGIPTAITPIRNACQVILTGKKRVVDAARCNGKPMILLAGIGYEAEIVEKASRELKDQWGPLAYFIAGWQQMNEQKLFETEIRVENTTYEFKSAAITVANAAPATSVLAQGKGEVIVDDGLLDVTVAAAFDTGRPIRNPKLRAVTTMANMLGAALIKVDPNLPDIFHFRTSRIQIVTDPPQKITLDGEIIGTTPVEFESIPQSLIVLVPDN